jgi:hypothetical protein
MLHPSRRISNTNDVMGLVPSPDKTKFPGALPIGLRITSLNYIADIQNRSRYLATAKLDGVRVIAIMCNDGLFLLDRTMSVFQTDCPLLSLAGGHCILDGELIDDRCVFAFDAMVVNGINICDLPYQDRYNQLCTFLTTIQIPGALHVVPKRLHRVEDLHRLFDVLAPHTNPHLFSIHAADVCHEKWATTVHGTFEADGIIFMDSTSTFRFDNEFGLVKWKQKATFDVLLDMRDLCTRDGKPLMADTVQTYYWEFSERMRKSVRVPFVRCVLSSAQRVEIWTQRMHAQRAITVCVECFRDRNIWQVMRCRPEKNRSNSSRTINDTIRIDEEDITGAHMFEAFSVYRGTNIDTKVVNSEVKVNNIDGTIISQPLHTLCNSLSWIGYTWAQSTDICELELRLTHEGTSSIPSARFHRILERLRMNPSMVQSEIASVDYTCGTIRVTTSGDTSYTIQKEAGFRSTFALPGMSPIGMRCVLSYEHPSTSWDMDYVLSQYTTRRQKRRWRFVHRETVAIDCTYVQMTDWRDHTPVVESYEIEIELLRSARYKNIPYNECGGLIMSLVWRMLLYVLGVPVETTNIIRT